MACGTPIRGRGGAADLDALLAPLREHADVLSLTQQPLRWNRPAEPVCGSPPRQSAINGCPLLVMEPGDPRIAHQQFLPPPPQEQGEKAPGACRLSLSPRHHDADVIRLLDWFFRVKPVRMAEQKLPNVFAEPGVEQFIAAPACRLVAKAASSTSMRSNATTR